MYNKAMATIKQFEAADKQFPVYITEPTGPIKGGLIVVEEIWGLRDHIKQVADRFAAEGYLVLSPDLLSEIDITEEMANRLQVKLFNPKTRNEAQPQLRTLMAPMQAPDFAEVAIAKLKTCFDYLIGQPETQEKVAITGFCFGGSYSFSLAVAEPRLKAAIPFYGHTDYDVAQLKQIKCPILAFYGEKDERLIEGLEELRSKMDQAGVDFTAQVYPGCGHAFFNDTNPFAYNRAAATDAWSRALEFLATNLTS